MARRIAGVGRVTVSLRKSTMGRVIGISPVQGVGLVVSCQSSVVSALASPVEN